MRSCKGVEYDRVTQNRCPWAPVLCRVLAITSIGVRRTVGVEPDVVYADDLLDVLHDGRSFGPVVKVRIADCYDYVSRNVCDHRIAAPIVCERLAHEPEPVGVLRHLVANVGDKLAAFAAGNVPGVERYLNVAAGVRELRHHPHGAEVGVKE